MEKFNEKNTHIHFCTSNEIKMETNKYTRTTEKGIDCFIYGI